MITHADIISMVQRMNMPYAYHHFAEGESPQTPFLVFYYPESEHFGADNKVYVKFNELNIELYTSKKDITAETAVETILDSEDLFYKKAEYYIESEGLYEVLYEMRLV